MNKDEGIMTPEEFRKELSKPGPVWAWVNLFEHDGEYVQVNKSHLTELFVTGSNYRAVRRDNGLYIN